MNLPIPFVNEYQDATVSGSGWDFATINGERTLECIKGRLCGVCGQRLEYWMAFVGGPPAAAEGVYADPPMHPECARDALTLCPHMFRREGRRRVHSNGLVPPGMSDTTKPEHIILYLTRGYEVVLKEGYVFFLPAPARYQEVYEYGENGTLRAEPSEDGVQR